MNQMWQKDQLIDTLMKRNAADLSEFKLEYKLTCMKQRDMFCARVGTSMRAIRCVSGESLWKGCTLTMMNDLSRQSPTHAQLLFTQERDTLCRGWESRRQRLSLHVLLMVCGCAIVCKHCWVRIILETHGQPCEWHGRGITRVSGSGVRVWVKWRRAPG